ncbi:UvrD-helicase domain-containing protein [Photobacterium kishitanii]|uniref:UvrD-helicase domain-containing protein n=1 Tax=Photobacterium kishitanii TaxID=318456 RepID=UPI00071AEEB6|nr:ATP-dependent helicase [Photobacterium kishitanii]
MFVWDENLLNDEQVKAINEPDSVFLIACPGSGKTRTLTYKIAKELSVLEHKNKWIVAITYTHRAADEIKERIESLGVDTSKLWIGTIHSFCLEWILKPYGCYHSALKYGFRVINSHETEELLTPLCAPFSNEKVSYYDCGYYYTSQGMSLSCQVAKKGIVGGILSQYHSILLKNNQIDFEQILFFSYQLIMQYSSISKILSGLFTYILVDEYQDTKEIQYAIFASILRSGNNNVKAFIVGDPNQAIYTSLGGYAISVDELRVITNLNIVEKELSKNYRSSKRIIKHFSHYKVFNSTIVSEGENKDFPSIVIYDKTTDRQNLSITITDVIKYYVEECGLSENEVCIVAPWWVHLATLTRGLSSLLPEYSFNGPGMTPFARDVDNFWYKLTKIILTEPSPTLFVRRIRWAKDIINDLHSANVGHQNLTNRSLLREINSIKIDEQDGLTYLRLFFEELFKRIGIDFNLNLSLLEHHTAFFESSYKLIDKIKKEHATYAGDIDTFRNVFKPRKGITVSTIHGVKGAEFDAVIAYGLLDGFVPHFSDSSEENAKKLIYVIGSRARKHLYLISEKGRMTGFGYYRHERIPTRVLEQHVFNYNSAHYENVLSEERVVDVVS